MRMSPAGGVQGVGKIKFGLLAFGLSFETATKGVEKPKLRVLLSFFCDSNLRFCLSLTAMLRALKIGNPMPAPGQEFF